MPQSDDLRAIFYTAMREELMKRLELRDQALALTATVMAVLLGYGISTSEFKADIVLVMAPLSVGATYLVLEHSVKIAHIASYLASECDKHWATCSPETDWRPWDISTAAQSSRPEEYIRRAFGEGMILLLPVLIALYLGFPSFVPFDGQRTAIWVLGLGCAAAVLAKVIRHYRWRTEFSKHNSISSLKTTDNRSSTDTKTAH